MADPKDLMSKYCDGEARAFRELYALIAPRLFGYLVKMARDRSLADDLLQLTFMKVHRSRAAYIRGADPLPWVFAIAHRTFIDDARRLKRAPVRLVDADELHGPHADLDGKTDNEREDRGDPALIDATLDALAELPALQREAVVLMKLDGRSAAEAAEIAGTTEGAMRVRAHRGYEALRQALGQDKLGRATATVGAR